MTEILPFFGGYRESAVGVSRCNEFGILLPESVLSKRYASNKTRMPPLQGNTLLEVERFPFFGDNQGGTADYKFVPELRLAVSGFFYLKRRKT